MNFEMHSFMGMIYCASAIGLMAGSVLLCDDVNSTVRKMISAGFVFAVAWFATGWLWGPWLFLGVNSIHRWNMANVNDMGRPVIVQEPTELVRPSAADEVEP